LQLRCLGATTHVVAKDDSRVEVDEMQLKIISYAQTLASLESVGREVIERHLAPRQVLRAGRAIAIACGKLAEHERNGRTVRNDDFFVADGEHRSHGQEVAEATLLAAMNSAEERNVDFIASLLANIATDKEIRPQTAHLMIDQAQRLTFRSFIILRIVAEADRHRFPSRSLPASSTVGTTAELEGLALETHELTLS
jgi:hypothetical protein